MRVGVIGNTVLTYKTIKLLMERGHDIQYVFGLPDAKLATKVNAYNLKDFCLKQNIPFYGSDNWGIIAGENTDLVCEMGDSRIIPAAFLQKNHVIGNHGAILPSVQGAASLVWGKMLNNGEWGVSLMQLSAIIDGGPIIKTRKVTYDTEKTTMSEFVELCDDATIECLKDFLDGNYNKTSNKKWQLKIAKKSDSKSVTEVLDFCLKSKTNVYLPPRTPNDSKVNTKWGEKFVDNFKKANDAPYPKHYSENS
jgi:methionyl-tRNA formyltransferase